MIALYHDDIVFTDPVFGTLKGDRAKKMWEMLLYKKQNQTNVTYSNVQSSSDIGGAEWVAEYEFGDKKRKVVNKISARFKFKDGKIIEHTDTFDIWKWSRQALGLPGYLLGWTLFMRKKIRSMVNGELYKLNSPKTVNERRKKMGLEPIEEYLKHFNIEYSIEE